MKAVVKAKTTRHPWLVACDANIDLKDCQKMLEIEETCMLVEAP